MAPPPSIDPALERFHPLLASWFVERLGRPSEPQRRGWPLIAEGQPVLIAAPTGSGKTLAAFLHVLDRLFRKALEGTLEERVHVVYVSPLKALGNDVQKNLLAPLAELFDRARDAGLTPQPIRVQVRTGDTPAKERQAMAKRPPHVLITTPESLYLYLTAQRTRATVKDVELVVVDEIHALARDKRGAHLALSLERLKALTAAPPQLIGLSATQKPLSEIAGFLTGADENGQARPCQLVEVGHQRPWELSLETPDQELGAVASHEAWGQIYDRLLELAHHNRTVLIFANTRRLAERVAHDLGERLGEGTVAAHHGSMAKELRLAAEERLKNGQLRVMVATASLELGIDIGSVDVVCQLGTPRSIAAFLQRVGRSGHQYGGTSRGVLFAMTRDELVECAALIRAVRSGSLDAVRLPRAPLDVLAQQLVAICAEDSHREDELFDLVRRAWSFRKLEREKFDQVVTMLSEGISTRRGRSTAHLHRDRVHGTVKGRRGARILALTNGGTIADTFTYPVILEPEGRPVGTIDEDFAVESMAGDVFLLGSTAWRVQSVRAGSVRVEDAHGQAPTVPFWLGEAPSRTDELSQEVSKLREDLLAAEDPIAFARGLGLGEPQANALVDYLRAIAATLGAMPTQKLLVAERFFDEAGGMQLLIHAPFGGRINRAFGLALRKRFCRTFDFELQAAASDDGVLLSLGEQHSFPLEEVFDFLHPSSVEEVLTQAILQAPLFPTRFRHVATRALALRRFGFGQRTPPPIQRARAEDLLAAVFPAQVGCQDNHGGGDVEVPDHPLVAETLSECLRDALDVDGLRRMLEELKAGRIGRRAVDLPEPSPLAHALLNSQPYTYLDDAPLEERRARAVSLRRTLPPEDAASFGALDAEAIAQVVSDAAPPMRDAEEVHDALLQLGLLPDAEASAPMLALLREQHRAAALVVDGRSFHVAAERVALANALFPGAVLSPPLTLLLGDVPVSPEAAALAVVRGTMEIAGPTTAAELAARLALPESSIASALAQLEAEGQVLRGTFRPRAPRAGDGHQEMCDRRLLQRIHRLTVGRLRKEIEPLSGQDFMRFLFRWHHLEGAERLRGKGGLLKAVSLLSGFEAPASAWEKWLLPARMKQYLPELLERACWEGEVAFCRLSLKEARSEPGPRRGAQVEPVKTARRAPIHRNASLTFMRRDELDWMLAAARPTLRLDDGPRLPDDLSHAAKDVAQCLDQRGACFFQDLVQRTRRLPAEVEDGLWELLARGLVTADAVENLRVLQSSAKTRLRAKERRGGPGRWSLLVPQSTEPAEALVEKTAKLLLRRYGILFRDVAIREALSPSWRELLYVLRRMEARGEVRGGRFVAQVVGEQFALPDAVEMARQVRRTPGTGEVVHLSAVDPLNLTGVVIPGARIAATPGQVITFVDGVPNLPTREEQPTT